MLQVGKIVNGRKIKMSRFVAVLTFLALAGAGFSGCFSSESPSVSGGTAAKHRAAPEFELPDSTGHSHKISEYRGKLVLLHFWASWCPPCLGEIPQWVELANEIKDKNFQMIAVSLDDGWPAALKVLPVEKLPPQIVLLLDTKSAVSDSYGSYAFPETYLINQKGEILTKWIGPQDWRSPAMLKVFEKFLNTPNL